MLARTVTVCALLLTLTQGHYTGGGRYDRWDDDSYDRNYDRYRERYGRYCRDNYGYVYRCDDSSWGTGSRWNNYYGNGGYNEAARYLGRGRVSYRGRGGGVELICDYRRDGRLRYGERVINVVWKKVSDGYYGGGGGYYGSGGGYSGSGGGYYGSGGGYYGSGGGYYGSGGGYYGNGGGYYGSGGGYYGNGGGYYGSGRRCRYDCGGGGGYRDRNVAGWVTTDRDSSTLTLMDPRPYDAGRYRCIAQVSGGGSYYGRGRDLVYMEVDFRGGYDGGYYGGGYDNGYDGYYSYGRSFLKKGEEDKVVTEDDSTSTEPNQALVEDNRVE